MAQSVAMSITGQWCVVAVAAATYFNEVMKRLTVVASLLLLPTFIVGLYGQNFRDIPELRWRFGYAFSWLVILLTTVGQLVYFRRRRWI